MPLKELKDRSFNKADDRLFYKLSVISKNEATWSPEAFEAALTAVKDNNVLGLEMPKDQDSMFEYVKQMNTRAEGFTGLITMAVTLIGIGAVTREELNCAIDEMLKDTKLRDRLRRI